MIITEYNEEWDNEARRSYYIERGLQQGIEQGRKENQLSMIKNFLPVKTPIEFIAKATGWSEEQILKLAKTDSEIDGVKFYDD